MKKQKNCFDEVSVKCLAKDIPNSYFGTFGLEFKTNAAFQDFVYQLHILDMRKSLLQLGYAILAKLRGHPSSPKVDWINLTALVGVRSTATPMEYVISISIVDGETGEVEIEFNEITIFMPVPTQIMLNIAAKEITTSSMWLLKFPSEYTASESPNAPDCTFLTLAQYPGNKHRLVMDLSKDWSDKDMSTYLAFGALKLFRKDLESSEIKTTQKFQCSVYCESQSFDIVETHMVICDVNRPSLPIMYKILKLPKGAINELAINVKDNEYLLVSEPVCESKLKPEPKNDVVCLDNDGQSIMANVNAIRRLVATDRSMDFDIHFHSTPNGKMKMKLVIEGDPSKFDDAE